MKDVTGNTLQIGDKVATTVSCYEELQIVYVTGFAPCKIRVNKESIEGKGSCKFPSQVVKIFCTENLLK